MMRNKNRLFGRHFETVQIFILFIYLFIYFFCRIVIFYGPYIYCANFIAKFRWENGFLGGGRFHGTPLPLGTNGSKSTLVT